MNKKLYIHVGPPKTGTSVIQFWLSTHAPWLRSQGVYYPQHELDSNSVSSGHRALFLERLSQTTRTQFNHAKFQQLLTEFNETDCSSLLLSSEFFFYQIPEFLKYREQYNIQFIAYVRADFELIESLYNQSVKRNGQVLPLPHRSQLPKSYLDELIDSISIYSECTFNLRAYGDSTVFHTDIITDLLTCLDLDPPTGYTPHSEKINTSYSFECLEFKRWVNKFDLGNLDHRIDQCLQGFKSNSRSYSLLPANTYQCYKEQSLEKIMALQALAPIENYENLINYVKAKNRASYIHQELYPDHLTKVGKYLLEADKSLLSELVTHIGSKELSDLDVQYLELLRQLLGTDTLPEQKRLWLSKLMRKMRE